MKCKVHGRRHDEFNIFKSLFEGAHEFRLHVQLFLLGHVVLSESAGVYDLLCFVNVDSVHFSTHIGLVGLEHLSNLGDMEEGALFGVEIHGVFSLK
jgi:hypothetical protein